jgi:hypothetical protein
MHGRRGLNATVASPGAALAHRAGGPRPELHNLRFVNSYNWLGGLSAFLDGFHGYADLAV